VTGGGGSLKAQMLQASGRRSVGSGSVDSSLAMMCVVC
jgi:hypothetical protein